MAKTFKQQVEEIESVKSCKNIFCRKYGFDADKPFASENFICPKCRTNRILSAHNAELDRIAEGMPDLGRKYVQPNATSECIALVEGMARQYKSDQAYIQARRRECETKPSKSP